ncbi:LacI family DNA-binding transcriptional regulator [Paracoccus albus]|uniref:LacI family DNA-binding transcriptional regulator n=1 Tax=Paracoccus albus TaxID=3017784 RepID=UPI0022F0D5AD|nr:LacI family DNA-binding transcriptional regulator [Paracoccus albus]WBU61507.1 LacI family DNA-binding transcriptional regulator [Paracoccus albus]
MDRTLNMRDVARRANVSVATVSRALRCPEKVSADTAQRIQAAAAELGYVYNASASDILTGRSTVIGLLVPTASNALFGETLHGVQDVTADAGYSVIQCATHYEAAKEATLIDSLLQRRVHAMILTGATDQQMPHVEKLAGDGRTRVVMVWEKPADCPSISYVGIDNRQAARRMTEHLIGLGHRRIGLIVGPYTRISRARSRLEGYRDALEAAGIGFDGELVLERRPDLLEGYEAMERLMSRDQPPTAVFAASDVFAIGALKAAKAMGYSVPRDVSLAGFDDMDMVAYQDPPLTTIRVDAYRIGKLAAQIALEPIGSPSRNYCLDSDLIVRGSTGPCARRG